MSRFTDQKLKGWRKEKPGTNTLSVSVSLCPQPPSPLPLCPTSLSLSLSLSISLFFCFFLIHICTHTDTNTYTHDMEHCDRMRETGIKEGGGRRKLSGSWPLYYKKQTYSNWIKLLKGGTLHHLSQNNLLFIFAVVLNNVQALKKILKITRTYYRSLSIKQTTKTNGGLHEMNSSG